ncbi:MAG: flagellin [Deltaproteobacteria bacterium]|nr:flagellin [Deltaproteobacteria bacterium]
MSLTVNHNLMSMNVARNLDVVYNRLAQSTQRLSSGLRINSAADDAAGLAIREIMRTDIAVINQGVRNASDAVSMIQTAEGGMSVIDEKLTRMKELAEQAATGTYTTVQRDIMNSEYQAMAKEIDRIANATNFNGMKLLDGSMTTANFGQGMKIHFGTGNQSAEDYYFIRMGDVRATAANGLRVGGDAKNDIWGQAGTGAATGGGCCGSGPSSLTSALTGTSGRTFTYGYNWDLKGGTKGDVEGSLSKAKYLGGMYRFTSGESLQQIVDQVNAGSQSRIKIEFSAGATGLNIRNGVTSSSAATRICLGNEAYYWGSSAYGKVAGKDINKQLSSAASSAAGQLVVAINTSSKSFWAMRSGSSVYVFAKKGGDFNSLRGCDEQAGLLAGSASAANKINWRNVETGVKSSAGTAFTLGGNQWGTFSPALTAGGTYALTFNGLQVGDQHDLWVVDTGNSAVSSAKALPTGGTSAKTYGVLGTFGSGAAISAKSMIGFTHADFTELQNAADGQWAGAEIRTQSAAQEALDAITTAIQRKDVIRANLGAYQNRLQNTITVQGIMAENLQASESRISDCDIATEMTEFTKNNILAQAATAMLAQANSLPQLALQLLK